MHLLVTVVSDLEKFVLDADLSNVSEEMMQLKLSDDNLDVSSEEEVCEMLMNWLDAQTNAQNEIHLLNLLSLIRWSDISVDYIRDKLLCNTTVTTQEYCLTFLHKVLAYLWTGVQFEGLQTFHRHAMNRENCMVILGLSDGTITTADVFRITLQQTDNMSIMNKIPTKRMNPCCSSLCVE